MEEIQFNHTLPHTTTLQWRRQIRPCKQHCLLLFLWFRKNGIFRFRMPGCRLGKGWYRCRPYWSKLPRTDLWFGPYRRANCRHWDRNQKLPPRPTGHWYGNPRSKMRMYLRHGSLRPRQTRVQATGRKWIEAICKYEGKDLKKRINPIFVN